MSIWSITWARGHHTRLGTSVSHHSTTLWWEATRARRIVEWSIEVTTRDTSSSGLLHADLVALSDLALKLLPADLPTLGEGDVERLRANHLVVHLSDSLGGLVRGGEADETEALGGALLVTHHLGTGDGAEWLKLRTEAFVVDLVVEVLDVQVNALVLADLLHLGLLVRLAQLLLALSLLLGTSDKELAALVLGVVKSFHSLLGLLVGLEVNETKATALALVVDLDDRGCDVAKLLEEGDELVLGDLRVEVLDVDVGELSLHLLKLRLALL